MNDLQVARLCHEANRDYCITLGDESQLHWEEAPQWQQQSALNGVMFHVKELKAGVSPSASASHDSWLAEKKAEGWKYGKVKNPDRKEHPCFVPYNELPVEQRFKDHLFGAIVKASFLSER